MFSYFQFTVAKVGLTAQRSSRSVLQKMIAAFLADGKFIDIKLEQAFNTCGLFVDYGTGRNTPRGNPGDIGKANGRLSPLGASFTKKRKRWFSRKYFASVMNIQEFCADSLGQEFCRAIFNALNPDIMRCAVLFNIKIQ